MTLPSEDWYIRLLRTPWITVPAHRVRDLFPWARIPVATINAPNHQYVVYTDDDAGKPITIILRVDVTPHQPVGMATIHDLPASRVVTLAAMLAEHDTDEPASEARA